MTDIKLYIGVPTGEFGRQAIFYDYLALLEKPIGTIGSGFHSNSGAKNRNLIFQDAIDSKCTHVLVIDDDMAFAANALMNLLSHDVDIVSGLCLNRVYPHYPVISHFENDVWTRRYLQDGMQGLIEVGICGFGFTLIKTSVFEKMEPPYVRLGEMVADRRGEDTGFCYRASKAGIKIYCDLDTPIGHMGTATFWPGRVNDKWYTGVDTNGSQIAMIPQLTSDKPKIITPLSYEKEAIMGEVR